MLELGTDSYIEVVPAPQGGVRTSIALPSAYVQGS
jgi:hypothetical protein